MEITKKKILVVSSLLLICTLVAVGCGGSKQASSDKQFPSEKETIKIGMNNWAENIAICHMWEFLLEEKGYDVKLVNGEKAPIWAGIGKGDLDLVLEVWLPKTDKPFWKKYKDNLNKYGPWYENTGLGLVVPEYVDIDSIKDLPKQEDKFKKDGKPSIVGIDSGASLMRMTRTAIKKYNLDYKLISSSGPAMTSSLKRAYKNKEPIVVTLWNPHWAFADFDLKYLKDPKNVYGGPEDVYFITHKGFQDQYPQVFKWLKNWQMNDQTLGGLMATIKKSDDAATGAEKWIRNNRSVVNKWLTK